MELMEYFEEAQKSLFRWEALQEYRVEGDDDPKELQEWWHFIENKTKNGVVMQRVRLVAYPLTDYTKKEIEVHKQSAKRGDDIRYVLEDDMYDLEHMPDFWIVDNKTVLMMKYDMNGVYEGFNVAKNIQKYLDFKKMVYSRSQSISEFKVL